MEDNILVFVIFLLAIFIIVLFLLRFRKEAGAEISLFDWFKLKVWGKDEGKPTDGAISQKIHADSESYVSVGDVVAGDKITTVYGETLLEDAKPPSLKLLLVDRAGDYLEDLIIDVKNGTPPQRISFKIAVLNISPASTATGLAIRAVFSWRGDEPTKAPKLFPPSIPNGWQVESNKIQEDSPAVLKFADPDLTSFYGHPLDWGNSRIQLPERIQGSFLVDYLISSNEPFTESQGRLILRLRYPKNL